MKHKHKRSYYLLLLCVPIVCFIIGILICRDDRNNNDSENNDPPSIVDRYFRGELKPRRNYTRLLDSLMVVFNENDSLSCTDLKESIPITEEEFGYFYMRGFVEALSLDDSYYHITKPCLPTYESFISNGYRLPDFFQYCVDEYRKRIVKGDEEMFYMYLNVWRFVSCRNYPFVDEELVDHDFYLIWDFVYVYRKEYLDLYPQLILNGIIDDTYGIWYQSMLEEGAEESYSFSPEYKEVIASISRPARMATAAPIR